MPFSLQIGVITLFEPMFAALTEHGITGRALRQGLWQLHNFNPRDEVTDNYRRVDDRPYGGGPGMVMLAEPLTRSVQRARRQLGSKARVVAMSPQGLRLTHDKVITLSQSAPLIIVCGRYEGMDQRFVESQVDEQISVGDFVVSGGELPAMMMIDAIVRCLPGALNDEQSAEQDSFVNGLLDCPHYSRPPVFEGREVPEVLQSGNHALIQEWRRKESLRATLMNRPDLIETARRAGLLTAADERWLASLSGV
jgi:tRNA (guanine37-N1)-methyltransferase